jgi:hypothetical protein
MDCTEHTLEMRGRPGSDIADYFLSIHGKRTSEGTFEGKGWEVELREGQPVFTGTMRIPVIFVEIRCRKELLEEILAGIRTHFLACGGGG